MGPAQMREVDGDLHACTSTCAHTHTRSHTHTHTHIHARVGRPDSPLGGGCARGVGQEGARHQPAQAAVAAGAGHPHQQRRACECGPLAGVLSDRRGELLCLEPGDRGCCRAGCLRWPGVRLDVRLDGADAPCNDSIHVVKPGVLSLLHHSSQTSISLLPPATLPWQASSILCQGTPWSTPCVQDPHADNLTVEMDPRSVLELSRDAGALKLNAAGGVSGRGKGGTAWGRQAACTAGHAELLGAA